jgi:hypothetical protein
MKPGLCMGCFVTHVEGRIRKKKIRKRDGNNKEASYCMTEA